MPLLAKVEGWQRSHLVSDETKKFYKFFCKRKAKKEICNVWLDGDNFEDTCVSCVTRYRNSILCDCRENSGVGLKLKVPLEVSESGWIKIIGDQTDCKPNELQPGVRGWDYLAAEWDEDSQRTFGSYFEVTKEELEEWKEIYQ